MHLGEVQGAVIDITNDDIHDDRVEKQYGDVLQLGYIGGNAQHKGFYFMADRLQQIYDGGKREFVCHTFMLEDAAEYPFVVNHGPYQYGEQKEIFKSIDVLVVPSKCRETYGMVVLEAISNGVPVLVSEYVGAKTLIKRFPGIGKIFSLQGDDFVNVIQDIYNNRRKLGEMNKEILRIPFDFDMKKHAAKIEELYTRV
jgi:glycosyltransferase involved in cell wall biosynthesis